MESTGSAVDLVAETGPDAEAWSCVGCPLLDKSFCAALQDEDGSFGEGSRRLIPEYEVIPARDIIYYADRPTTHAYAICEGWAISFVRLRDGRRHIVQILIPGDFFAGIFRDSLQYSVQAVTEVRVGKYARPEIRARLMTEPRLLHAWVEYCAARDHQVAQMAVALGQFTANERIATLVLRLRDRLAARGFVTDESFAFPLRQTHIADATGLTTVHVSRVLSGLRKAGLLAINDGTLTILDLSKLRRIADVT